MFLTLDMCEFLLSRPEMLHNPFTLGTLFHVDILSPLSEYNVVVIVDVCCWNKPISSAWD